ncbi:MAG: neutral zinc metallopeptidase [Pirellulales bacterium]
MRWEGREGSENVDDRRGSGGSRGAPVVGGGILVLIIGAIMTYLSGGDPLGFLIQNAGQPGQQAAVDVDNGGPQGPRPDDREKEFSSVILRDTEIVWAELYPKISGGKPYRPTTLVVYTGADQTRGCGGADASVGPFYCPADRSVYIDLSFFGELSEKFGAPGEFARAYVIAHEVGHHVQNELNILLPTQRTQDNEKSVRLELQADFLAGVWAYHAQKKFHSLEPDDIKSGLNAAKQVGDDTIMRNAGVRPVPERFTHGTSEQRMRWFALGMKTGDPRRMNEVFDLPYDQL